MEPGGPPTPFVVYDQNKFVGLRNTGPAKLIDLLKSAHKEMARLGALLVVGGAPTSSNSSSSSSSGSVPMEIATSATQSQAILHDCPGIEVPPDIRIMSLESGKIIIVFGWF